MKEIAGIHFEMIAVAPEVRIAQTMSEFQQLATYRAKRLQKYKDWADPVKREEIKAKQKSVEEECRKFLSEIDAEKISIRTGESPIKVKDDSVS